MKNTALALALTSGLVASFGSQASCTVSDQIVERVISYGTSGYIYFRPEASLTNSTYYYMRTTSAAILAMAGTSQANRTKVNANGNVASCPTTGTGQYLGDATYLYMLN